MSTQDSMAEIVPFQYEGEPLRTLTIDGEPEFVAADVCRVLEHSNPSASVAGLDDDEKGLRIVETPSGAQQMVTVTEAGLYSLVIRSRKPEAKTFRRWITHDVLPAIRKTGTYAVTQSPEHQMALGLVAAQKMLTAKDEQIAELAEKIETDAPAVNYVELYVAEGDLMKFRVVAANNNVGEQWLRDLLIDKGWIYVETDSRWSNSKGCKEVIRRYSAYAHKRQYFRPSLNHEAPRFRGEPMHTLKITPAGAEAIARLVAKAVAAA